MKKIILILIASSLHASDPSPAKIYHVVPKAPPSSPVLQSTFPIKKDTKDSIQAEIYRRRLEYIMNHLKGVQ